MIASDSKRGKEYRYVRPHPHPASLWTAIPHCHLAYATIERILMTRQLSAGPFLITTAPSLTKCSRCRRMVLAVTINGFDRHVDPAALNQMGELAALMSGRKSYELHGELLVHRTVAKLGSPRVAGLPVMAEHACQAVSPAHCDQEVMEQALALVKRLLGAEIVLPDQPPF